MKRTVITMDGNGELSIPSNLKDLWMSEGELVDMLHVTAPKLHAVIRSIYEEGLLPMSEVQQKQETFKGIWQTMYGFPMVVALCFRIGSYGAVRFRDTIMKKLYGAKEKSSVIVLQFSGGTTAFNFRAAHRLCIGRTGQLLLRCQLFLLQCLINQQQIHQFGQ